MPTRYLTVPVRLALAGAILSIATACGEKPPASSSPSASATAASPSCAAEHVGITLPPGFCATIFADSIGHARHLVVARNGVVYGNTWSGRYYGNDKPHEGGFLVAMQDTRGTGHADVITRFGGGVSDGSHGGTGIGIYQNHLYAEVNDRIVRFPLGASGVDTGGQARDHRLRAPDHGRPPHASIHHRCQGEPVHRPRLRHQCLRGQEPDAALSREQALHREADPGRHLEVRREQAGPEVLPPSGMPPGSGTGKGLRSTPMDGCS